MLRMNMLVVSQVVSFNRPNFDGNKTLKTKCSDLRTRYLVIRVTRRPSAQCTRVFILRSPMGLFLYARMPHHQERTDEAMAELAFPLNDGVYWSRLARKVCQKNHSDSFIFKVKKFSLYPTNKVQLCTIPAAAVERSHVAESPCHLSSHWRLPFVHCPRRSGEWYPWSCQGRRAPTNLALWRPLKFPQHQNSKS